LCDNIVLTILHPGSPESWYLGTKYTDTVIHSVGFKDLPFDLASSSWGLPPNVLLEQWSEFPRLDYVDAIFDNVVIAHHLFESIKCTLWPVLIEEISRVLAPGGLMIVSIMDALPQRAGPLLDYWTHQNLNMNVLRRFMVHQPSLLLPSWVEESGHFCQELIERVEFPCMPALGSSSKKVESEVGRGGHTHKRRQSYTSILPIDRLGRITEVSEIRTAGSTTSAEPHYLAASRAGWNFYERLYSSFLSPSTQKQSYGSFAEPQLEGLKRDWWTKIDDVRKECYTQLPYFEMATFVYRRVEPPQSGIKDQTGQQR
jgi:SAM-dependent methyltransferase